MAKTSLHVVPGPDGGWNVKKGGALRASKHFETKKDAESWGLKISRQEGSVLVIHKRDGTIERKDSFGSDSLLPQDRRKQREG
jgi:uncharacterized protein DUF2188